MSVDVLIESGVYSVAVVIFLQLFLGGWVGWGRVCGETGSSWTGATPACQQVGLQTRNQPSTCTQVTQSRAPGGLELCCNVHSEERTSRRRMTSQTFIKVQALVPGTQLRVGSIYLGFKSQGSVTGTKVYLIQVASYTISNFIHRVSQAKT